MCVLLSIYLLLAARKIALPGIHDTEVFSACGTIDLLKNKNSHYCINVTFLGRAFPLMVQAEHASTVSYFLLPFFLLFGINVFSLRITSIFFGLFTLVFTYLFSKKAFNTGVALIATFLLATSPYFVSAIRVGDYYRSYASFFVISSAYYLFRWYTGGHIRYFLLGMFLLGLGCSTSLWFIEYLISLLFLAFIFWREIRKRIQNDKIKPIWLVALGIISLCLGNFLFIYTYFINGPTRFLIFKVIFKSFPYALYGVHRLNNLDFITNFTTRFNNLVQLLGENDIMTRHVADIQNNNLYPPLFFLIILWLIFLFFFKKTPAPQGKKIAFLLLLVCITLIITSCFGITQFGSYQLLILVPFIQIIVALGLTEFVQFFKNQILRKVSLGIVCLCLLILTTLNLNMLKSYFKELQRTGGRGSWPSAIYDLAGWIKKNNPSNVVAFGYAHSLYFLTQGEVRGYDFNIVEDQGRKSELARLLHDENTLYIFDIERPDLKPHILSLYKIINSMKKTFVKKKTFYQGDSAPIEVYTLE